MNQFTLSPQNIGLLTTGLGLLEGQGFNQAVRSGLGAYSLLDNISAQEEERRRQEQLAQTAVGLLGLPPMGPYRQENQALANLASAAPEAVIQQSVDQMFAAPAKAPTTTDITNFLFATQNGFTGTFPEFLQSQVPGGVTMNVPPTEIPPEEVTSIDIPTAAQGDAKGFLTGVGNEFTGRLFGSAIDEDALREAANLRAVNLGAQVPLTKSLSDKGSVYTQQNIARLLPQPSDTDAQMVAKMESLIPLLERQINEAKNVAANPNAQPAYKTNALEMLSSGPAALAAYKNAVENYRRREGQASPVTRRTQRRVVRDPVTGEFVDIK